jgi:hypothetical protein
MTELSQWLIIIIFFFLNTTTKNLRYLQEKLSIAGPHCLWLLHEDMDGGFLSVAEPHCVVALPGKQTKNIKWEIRVTEKAATLYGIRHIYRFNISHPVGGGCKVVITFSPCW